ncbi:hypothetical protein [Campylobacter gastrosuis]|uniref:Septum formation initiator n=1 Tax=Campylobacter gastrosuis TaxID=2974576 RepID=A0ABT7HQC5_9BACT|nr:hypothetical protein [Campylobacter gastrosuis]MDL0089127.1 hypothetical protein [Campylobacter gastrosuis]
MSENLEKDELLKLHDIEQTREQNLGFKTLMIAYLSLLIALCLFLPKIYIANQIYHISRDISEISTKRDVLLEENRALRIRLENIKYKYQILNPLEQN